MDDHFNANDYWRNVVHFYNELGVSLPDYQPDGAMFLGRRWLDGKFLGIPLGHSPNWAQMEALRVLALTEGVTVSEPFKLEDLFESSDGSSDILYITEEIALAFIGESTSDEPEQVD